MENQKDYREFITKTKLLFSTFNAEYKEGFISIKTLKALKEHLLPILTSNAVKGNAEELRSIKAKLDDGDFAGVEAFFKKLYIASTQEE